MNIFAVHNNPIISATQLCDKHVVKMIVESCQLLSTAHRILDGYQTTVPNKNGKPRKVYKLRDPEMESKLCKFVMPNHPCAIWTRESTSNYMWLAKHTLGLCSEYTTRYGKVHSMEPLAMLLHERLPENIPIDVLTEFVQAMPTQYKMPNPILGYRYYYCYEKSRFATWKSIKRPDWYVNLSNLKEHVKTSSIDVELNAPSFVKTDL
jgi:hypothetical protein